MLRPDPVAEESLALAGITSASVLGRVTLGRRAGARVLRLGREPDAPGVTSTGPRRAHLEGFDLSASLPVPADDRVRLAQRCRSRLRPPVAPDRLRLPGGGHGLLERKTAWAATTRQLLFEPLALLEKLAALAPRPRSTLALSHGVLAPHARWRRRAVSDEGPQILPGDPVAESPPPPLPGLRGEAHANPRSWAWADLMRRAFARDVLACPRWGGRLRRIAPIAKPQVIQRILAPRGLSTEVPHPGPRRPPALTASPTSPPDRAARAHPAAALWRAEAGLRARGASSG